MFCFHIRYIRIKYNKKKCVFANYYYLPYTQLYSVAGLIRSIQYNIL